MPEPKGRRPVPTDASGRAGLVPPGLPRLVPVGRLDRESEGLLLLTNDGDLAHRLQHPRYGVEKEYLAEVAGEPSSRTVRELTGGVELEDGPARALSARIVERRPGRAPPGGGTGGG